MNFKVEYKVKNKMNSPSLSDVSLDGIIGARFDRFAHERVSSDFAIKEILREAELCFRDQYDDEYNYGLWRSEFWGKLMISACRVCRMKGDEKLKDDLKKSVYTMLSYQREDGYLSAYRDADSILPCDTSISMRDVGWECNYNWNLWGQKYTLWALIEAAMLLDDEKVLEGARKLLDRLIDLIDRLGVRVKDAGVMCGMAASSILKPTLILYRLTADEKYLNFACGIARELDREDGQMPNLIRNAFSGKRLPSWYPAEDGWVSKAYEMMSTYDGIIELYRVTGEERLFESVKAFWELISEYEVNILGSAGYCERFENAKLYPDSATEVCDAIHWMRLSFELFSLSGERKYVAAFERAFLNAFLAGVYENGKSGAFFVRSAGRHYVAEPQVETKYQNCCLNNVGRGFANAAEIICSESNGEYFVNTYIQSKVRFGNLRIKISHGYVDRGIPTLSVRGAKAGTVLNLAIPLWADGIKVMIDGEVTEYTSGEPYARITLKGEDTLMYITILHTPRLIDFAGEYQNLPENDYHVRRWCDSMLGVCDRSKMVKHPMSVIYYGPILLARSKRIGAKASDMFSGKTVCGKGAKLTLAPMRHDYLLAAFKVKLETEDETLEYTMCDYSSAGNSDLEEAEYFTVFV